MVGNGILVVGDAACQVNPIHGGGIGPSMIGGQLAGETIRKALEKGDLSREGLWDYNVQYIRNYGAKQAGLEIFRILLQNMDDEELNFGMSHRLLTEEDVLQASLGKDVHFTISEKMKRAIRGLKKISVLKKLRTAADYMNNIKAWYKNYPELPQDFKHWKAKTENMFQQAIAELER
jgi:flavin-dependent dehydrogenase